MAVHMLKITVRSASNLYNADGWLAGKSDPYCTVNVVDHKKIKGFRTPTIDNELNPEWHFEGDIDGFSENMILEFEVWDQDVVGSTSLGKVQLPGRDVFPYGIEGQLQLTGGKATGTVDVLIAVHPGEMPAHHDHHAAQPTHEHFEGAQSAHPTHEVVHHAGHHQETHKTTTTTTTTTTTAHHEAHHEQHSGAHHTGADLEVHIIAAHGLPNMDGKLAGTSDPYALCFIHGHSYKTGIQTKTINNDVNPRWHFNGTIHNFDLQNDTLEFQVWDNDTFPKPDQLIGTALISAQEHDISQGLEGTIDILDSKTHHPVGALDVKILFGGGGHAEHVEQHAQHAAAVYHEPIVHPSVSPFPRGCKLVVTVARAHDLYNADGWLTGKSDPYVICEVPHVKHHQFRTKTLNNNLNPEWMHVGQIQHYEPGQPLKFTVWDEDTLKFDNNLGEAILESNQFFPQGLHVSLPLSGSKHATGTLEVQIEVTDADAVVDTQGAQTGQAVTIGMPYAGGILVAVNVLPPVLKPQPQFQAPQVVAPQQVTTTATRQVAPQQVITAAPQWAPQQVITAAPQVARTASSVVIAQPQMMTARSVVIPQPQTVSSVVTAPAQVAVREVAPITLPTITTVAAPQYVAATQPAVTEMVMGPQVVTGTTIGSLPPQVRQVMAPQVVSVAPQVVQGNVAAAAAFNALDVNHDGMITRQEFAAATR